MRLLITKESEVVDVITDFENTTIHRSAEKINIRYVKTRMDEVRHKVLDNNHYSSWQSFFLQTGAMMLQIALIEKIIIDKEQFAKFLLQKHHAYGAEPFIDWLEVGILMRLGSKMSRLINIMEDPDCTSDSNESFQDTFKDIIGYCVLGFYMDRLK